MRKLFRNLKPFNEKRLRNLIVNKGRIESFSSDDPSGFFDEEHDGQGQLVLPGFVECHTHLVYAGSRGFEMEMKFQGVPYQEIAQKGGGILSTMRATREASLAQLQELNSKRIQKFLEQGVTTLEVKSGYGLDKANEIKMLESLPENGQLRLIKTFLGAHAKPPEFSSYTEYLQYLVREVLPEIKNRNLAKRVDIFIEKGFFEVAESREYLQRAQQMGFDLTIHADQLSLSGGTSLAIELGAQSADHCLQVSDQEIQSLAKSKTVAVLLPAADLYLKCHYPPARKMLDSGVQVALSTDYNPGTSPTQDLGLVGFLARREMKMTLPEVLRSYTEVAAQALGLENEVGKLAAGFCADFTLWSTDEADLFLEIGNMRPTQVFIQGSRRN
jgi:imidazolonepropionase